MTDPTPLLAIDGPFVLFRSFFALPETIRDGDGRPVNALLGAANLILRIAAEVGPRAIVVCWGAEAATYRTELYAGYHADRPPVPGALQDQFERAPALLEAFGWASLGSRDLEADDLLGALARREEDDGGRALLMTGDRDMYQCASAGTSVVYLAQGRRGFQTVDPAEVRRRYGVEPAQVPDFIALRGDPSDGLPGASGIGPKTAGDLLRRHGSLAGAIAHAAQERPRVAAALGEHAAELEAYRRIATLQPVDVERPLDRPTDLAGGARAARAYGMGRLAERLEAADSLAAL